MSAKLRYLKRGFTLVELMIVVAIVGILAALAVYGVSRYVKNAKTAEARDALGRLGKDAVGAFDREMMAGTVLGLGESANTIHSLCAGVTSPVPAGEKPPAGAKYQSKPSEWMTNGWQCLRFSMNEPQYFQYNYTTGGTSLTGKGGTFSCKAKGDLDGSGDGFSEFSLDGAIVQEGTGPLVATLAPNFVETLGE